MSDLDFPLPAANEKTTPLRWIGFDPATSDGDYSVLAIFEEQDDGSIRFVRHEDHPTE